MAKVTWLGDESDAEENVWGGIVFKKGEAVEVTDERMLAKIKDNKYYKLGGPEPQKISAAPAPQKIAPSK